jgi:hypothetical protein
LIIRRDLIERGIHIELASAMGERTDFRTDVVQA